MALSFAVQSGDLMQVLSHRVLERLRRPLGRREHQLSAQVLNALSLHLTRGSVHPTLYARADIEREHRIALRS